MTTVVFVAVLVLCVAVGVWFYLHNGPDGGRDPGVDQNTARMQRLRARMDEDGTYDEAEARFQAQQRAKEQQPPTHEDG